MDRMMLAIPDRLAAPDWRERCRWRGLEPLRSALADGRPVLLAVVHDGPLFLLSHLLRSIDIPAVPFVEGDSSDPPFRRVWRHRFARFPEVPSVFYQDELKEFIRAVESGAVGIMAVDFPSGHQVRVPFDSTSDFQMATGSLRLAKSRSALLFPCAIHTTGPWRHEVRFGEALEIPEDGDLTGPAGLLFTRLVEVIDDGSGTWPPAILGRIKPRVP